MEITMNREKFQRIAELRMMEATILYEKEQFIGAYYLSGYVVECALKACIAKKMKKHDFPPDAKALKNIYTHKVSDLYKSASLPEIEDSTVRISWTIISKWSESVRYSEVDVNLAKESYEAVAHPKEGVFQWIKQYW